MPDPNFATQRAIPALVVALCLGCGRTEGTDAPAEQWQSVSANGGRITIEMPSPVRRQERTIETDDGHFSITVHKSVGDGVFFNLWTATYPPAVIAGHRGEGTFLEERAAANERQKYGAKRLSFTESEGEELPRAEHHFTYPSGTNADGQRYGAGFAKWKHYLVDSTVYSASVDVIDSSYGQNPRAIEDNVERFFGSFKVRED